MFLTLTLVVENLAMSEFTDPGSIVKMGQHTSSTTELSRDQEGTVRPSRALVRNGRHGLLPTDHEEIIAAPNSFDKKLTDFKENALKLIFFNGPDGEARIKRLSDIREVMLSINRGRKMMRRPGSASNVNEEHFLLDKEQTEYQLQSLRGRLSDIYDKKKSNPELFKSIDDLKDDLSIDEKNIWKTIKESEQEADRFKKKSQGLLGYFYSIWKHLFDNQNLQKQRLKQSLRKIRIQLRHRLPTSSERAILKLEEVQKAGFSITQKEQRLAGKIAKFSQVATTKHRAMPLSTDELNLLKQINHRTAPVRRAEQVEELLKRLAKTPQGAKILKENPQDFQLVGKALKELSSMERDGKIWSKHDAELMRALEFEGRNSRSSKSKLDQIVINLKKRKALQVLDVRAHTRMREKTDLHLKLTELNYVPTREEMADITRLAEQYYRMKEQSDTPLHLNIIQLAREKVQQEVLSTDQRAILWLEEKSQRKELDPSQEELLKKLKERPKSARISEEGRKSVQAHLKTFTAIPQLEKVKKLKELLGGTPELGLIQKENDFMKAQLWDELVYSRPEFEWWLERSLEATSDSARTPENNREALANPDRIFSLKQRGQVLVLSKRFRVSPNRSLPTLEELALKRLQTLANLKDFTVTQREMKLHDALLSSDFKELNTPPAKLMIRNLAIEETLINMSKAPIEDQKLVLKLAQNVKIGDLTEHARHKLNYLLPSELERLGKLISLEEDDRSFRDATKFSKMMELILEASDRIKLHPHVTEDDDVINFVVWDAQKLRFPKIPPSEERRVVDYLHAILDKNTKQH
ncbi:hypothetical protein Pst134EA_015432 [Puccinia striiformis f. sp. tritici]|nr:hypothetical protein Pst134EA_015432 [Puccinia striiformis f. sp. tritici]KAH9463349.1 hypothetical protein Pst134EA_015432 [Puccinia striiformis f. sp. tritici]